MSAPPISMRKLKDLLRLKYEAGLSQRQIARALRLSLGAVNKYLHAAQAVELTWPLPEDLTEAQLRRRLFPPGSSTPQSLSIPKIPSWGRRDFSLMTRCRSRLRIDDSISGRRRIGLQRRT